MDIISKIEQAGLVGRGGAGFPVAKKWEAVKNAAGDKKYVVCNAAEGEPGVLKDDYILEHYADRLIDGIKIAIDFLSERRPTSTGRRTSGYLYLRHDYYKKFRKKLAALIKNSAIEIFVEPLSAGYIGGEESAVLNAIEGQRIEPRLKPPLPAVRGLWNRPTLINNAETFYNVSLAAAGGYNNKRFYTISGDCLNEGVYELADDWLIEKILRHTNNYPKFEFFLQAGGGASGEVLNAGQLARPVGGAGSIAVFSLAKHDFKKTVKNWLDFFIKESCGQCAPCREGVLRLREVLIAEKIDWNLFNELLDNLSDASLCALGASVSAPIRSLVNNVFQQVS
ncbi:MAG: NADH-ubiquinone oxidoreductase-F iron-sulfur binding region domain-containing protein [bacterium]|nr:NADH-ubiquinone oxidoreductase-F iron-sulfur binding region domain-containing protein [bacterium]